MGTIAFAAAILLSVILTMATSEHVSTCEPPNDQIWIGAAEEISTACKTNFSSNGYEVHVLSLEFTTVDNDTHPIILSLSAMKPSHLIVRSNVRITIRINALDDENSINIIIDNLVTIEGHGSVPMSLPSDRMDLLRFVANFFKGVTSLTSIKDPRFISFSGTQAQGTAQPAVERPATDPTCKSPRDKLEETPLQMNLYTSSDYGTPIEFSPRIHYGQLVYAEISSTSLQEVVFQFNVTNCSAALGIAHNNVWDLPFTMEPCPPQACRHSTRLSFSLVKLPDLTPAIWVLACSTLLWTNENGHPCTNPITVKRNLEIPAPSLFLENTMPPEKQRDQVPLQMELYTSPDFKDPIDPATRVQSDDTIFAEISSTTLGGIVLQLKVTSCSAASGTGQDATWGLPFTVEPCPPQACRHSTRLSFSLMELPDPNATSWVLECFVQMCANMGNFPPGCVNVGSVMRNLQVTTSYSLPTSLPVMGESQMHGFRERKDTRTSKPPVEKQTEQVPLLMELYASTEFRDPVEPMTRLQSDKPVYAEVSYSMLGEISLHLRVTTCLAVSRSSCDAALSLPFTVEWCPPLDCRHSTRLSFSLLPLQQLRPTSWVLNCSVQMCIKEVNHHCLDAGFVKKNFEITTSPMSLARQCVDLGPSAVLGVAFGGFVTGVLLVGALWFIRIRTRYPCLPTKRDPVSANPPPLENSSGNSSLDSTRSTPTSSMA